MERVKSGDLIGSQVEIVVHEKPCTVWAAGCEPLTETTEGILRAFHRMPCGPIGIIERADGKRIVFDAGFDLQNGKIEIVVAKDWVPQRLTNSSPTEPNNAE